MELIPPMRKKNCFPSGSLRLLGGSARTGWLKTSQNTFRGSEMTPKVTIGIPTYKGHRRMEWVLQSIYQVSNGHGLEDQGAKIVLLDDGSPDGGEAVKILGQKYGAATICFPKNRG